VNIRGATQWRARLHAAETTGRVLARDWADEDVRRVRAQIQRRTGATSASVRAINVTDRGARVVGSPVVNFLASGTRAHDQAPVNAKAMRFKIGGQTIFSKKVHHPATRGNPRIREAARHSLGSFVDAIIGLWNRAA
jgi:hypothetical protein